MTLNAKQVALCDSNQTDFSGLSALVFNTTLKRDAGASHTQLLLDVVAGIMERNGVAVAHVNMASADVPPGVHPDLSLIHISEPTRRH